MADVNGDRASWLRCYRCWSQNLEVQIHYDAIRRIDPESGTPTEGIEEMQESVVQCLDCMHDQPHLALQGDWWSRSRIAGNGWWPGRPGSPPARSPSTRTRSRPARAPRPAESLTFGAFGDAGTREFFTHVRFHKHDDERIVVHLLVELYARAPEEATEVLEGGRPRHPQITSLAEESRPPAHASDEAH